MREGVQLFACLFLSVRNFDWIGADLVFIWRETVPQKNRGTENIGNAAYIRKRGKGFGGQRKVRGQKNPLELRKCGKRQRRNRHALLIFLKTELILSQVTRKFTHFRH